MDKEAGKISVRSLETKQVRGSADSVNGIDCAHVTPTAMALGAISQVRHTKATLREIFIRPSPGTKVTASYFRQEMRRSCEKVFE